MGLDAAIGFRLGAPERRVVAFVGDGGFLFSLLALRTAARMRLPLAAVVVDNRSYAAVKSGLMQSGGRAAALGSFPGTDPGGVSYATLAEGPGLQGIRISHRGELGPALRQALAADAPTVVEVFTDPEDVGSNPKV